MLFGLVFPCFEGNLSLGSKLRWENGCYLGTRKCRFILRCSNRQGAMLVYRYILVEPHQFNKRQRPVASVVPVISYGNLDASSLSPAARAIFSFPLIGGLDWWLGGEGGYPLQ